MDIKKKAHRRWTDCKRRAFEKGHKFTLSEQWFYDKLENGKCEITGLPFSVNKYRATTGSVDRIDNSKGYTENNCRMIYFCLNSGKLNLPDHLWYDICKKFIKWYEKQIP